MAEIVYINNQSQHNKYWSYEIRDSNTVDIKWGRIGGSGDSQSKSFNNSSELQRFINKKIKEKEKKGYKKESEDKLKKETKTARALGHQNKISKMLWVSEDGNTLTQLDQYDPKQFVYVEILNSWSKKVTRLLLSKSKTWFIDGGITEHGRSLSYGRKRELGFSAFADAVRQVLRDMAEVVAEALKSVKFAAVGARNLFDDDDQPAADVKVALAAVDTSGFDASVVHQFAALEARTLEL